MNFFRHRHRIHPGPPALALLIATAGCSSSDDNASLAVPSPDAKVTTMCRNLDEALPRTVDGLDRGDPRPRSALTAAWGSSAIILRCGVERPPKMVDPKVPTGGDPDAVAGKVDGIGWLMEKRDDGSYRFTTSSRLAYVEVTVSKERAGQDSSPVLIDLTPAIKKAVPEGIAD
ncbi:DUF3515 domain-containing protein [Streptomyces phyllanthi]|uniref:DUF3515 domain-containing protein n=1 Tax=Streptomyces phyllanthi TaxID=1803180 RepID=A0A5N8W2N1_9ACTN|nr:DUF3515 domain-containing protein [Streptomyces phyllanthi]MPY40425.1 DUF3515 domain-containing protein [Streptomyces phyllanthi]